MCVVVWRSGLVMCDIFISGTCIIKEYIIFGGKKKLLKLGRRKDEELRDQ